MAFSRVLQIFLGVSLAVMILIAGGGAIAFLMMNRLLGLPPKPVFANDNPPKTQAAAKPTSPQATAKPSPKPTATPSPKPTLEPGAYEARVTWSEGLTLRNGPGYDASAVGGIDYNTPVVVLEDSADGEWQRVRLPNTREEGWVRAGNVERTGDDATGQ